MPKLASPKQEKFAQHFALNNNATAAYRHAYSTKTKNDNTVWVEACKLLKNPKVAPRVKELQKIASDKAEEEFEIDAKWMLGRLKEIDDMDILDIMSDDGSLKPISEWPKVWRQSLMGLDVTELFGGRGEERDMIGILKRIKWPDKLKNLEMLGRHVDVQAFKDRVDARVESVESLLDELTGGGSE